MTTLISSATAIDLAKLPPPAVVEQLDYEAIRTAMIVDFKTRWPEFDALVESEPAIKLIESFAWRELVLRADFNDRARGLLLAYAEGSDLDHLASLFGVLRLVITPANAQTGTPAILESDSDLRRRVLLAPDSYSVAGPESAYVFHALSADSQVRDASAITPAPGDVLVSIQARDGDGTAPPMLVAQVATLLASDGIRPLTDRVTVQSATIVPVAITARLFLYPGPDADLVRATALERLAAWIADAERLGRDVTRSAIIAALHVPGAVQRVELVAPAADIVLDRTQAANIAHVAVTVDGYAF